MRNYKILLTQLAILVGIALLATVAINCSVFNIGYFIGLFDHSSELNLDITKGEYKDIIGEKGCGITTTNDPWVIFRNLNVPMENVELSMDTNSASFSSQLFYTTAENPTFNEQMSKMVNVQNDTSIKFDFPDKVIVRDLRLDITNISDAKVYISSITVNKHPDFVLNKRTLFYSFCVVIILTALILLRLKKFPELFEYLRNAANRLFSNHGVENKSIYPNVFLVVSLVFGLLFVFVTPPLQSPDEGVHFIRSYLLNDKQLFPIKNSEGKVGNYLPSAIVQFVDSTKYMCFHPENKYTYSQLIQNSSIKLDFRDTLFNDYQNAYSLAYLPQAFGMRVARELYYFFDDVTLSPALLMYFGRVFNLLLYIICIYMAIKRTPILKGTFLFLALMPMSIFQAASLSYDVLINSVLFLWLAIIFDYAFSETTRVKYSELVIMALLFTLVNIAKPVYSPMLLMVLLIPKNKIKKKPILTIGSFLALNCVLYMGWSILAKHLTSVAADSGASVFSDQVNYILSDPVQYIGIMLRTLTEMNYEISFYGVLGWLDTYFPSAFYLIGLAMLVVTVILDEQYNEARISNKTRIWSFMFGLGSIFLIFLALYTLWSPLKSNLIYGVQGRYFIPLIPTLVLFFVFNLRRKGEIIDRIRYRYQYILPAFCAFALSYTAFILVLRYWI